MFNAAMTRPFLARDKVRFVGEPVAVIVTERPEQGADAAELVWADYDPLPAVVDPARGGRPTRCVLHEAAGTNIVRRPRLRAHRRLLRRLRGRRHAGRGQPARGGGAARGRARRRRRGSTAGSCSGRAPSTPTASATRSPASYGLDPTQVRVIAPDVGGGFGAKIGGYPEELLLGWLSRQVGRPVRWLETRSENMVGLGHGRGAAPDDRDRRPARRHRRGLPPHRAPGGRRLRRDRGRSSRTSPG